MAKIKILAGDLPTGSHTLMGSTLMLPGNTSINLSNQVVDVETLTEQNKKKITGTLVGGAAGLALLGPLGAIGGMLLGGNKKDVSFVVNLTTEKQFLVQADSKIYMKFQAWAMEVRKRIASQA